MLFRDMKYELNTQIRRKDKMSLGFFFRRLRHLRSSESVALVCACSSVSSTAASLRRVWDWHCLGYRYNLTGDQTHQKRRYIGINSLHTMNLHCEI